MTLIEVSKTRKKFKCITPGFVDYIYHFSPDGVLQYNGGAHGGTVNKIRLDFLNAEFEISEEKLEITKSQLSDVLKEMNYHPVSVVTMNHMWEKLGFKS